jgi:hypothetical protein
MALDSDVGWAAGFVSAGVVWMLLAGEGGSDAGLRRPGEVFDGLVAGWLDDVDGPDDGVGSELRDERAVR